jgi:hypothetical protein
MPPSVLVETDGVLVDSFGGVSGLLTIKSRRPSVNGIRRSSARS